MALLPPMTNQMCQKADLFFPHTIDPKSYPFHSRPIAQLKSNTYLCTIISKGLLSCVPGGIAQLARAFEWHSKGHGFDSRYLHNLSFSARDLPIRVERFATCNHVKKVLKSLLFISCSISSRSYPSRQTRQSDASFFAPLSSMPPCTEY